MTRTLSQLITIFCLFAFFSQTVHAEVLIQAETASVDEYLAQIKTDETKIALVDELEKTRPNQTHGDSFAKKFERAQALYLSNDEAKAMQAFDELVQTSREADWRETQRQALVYSYLRLAQLTVDPRRHDGYLQQAARFAPDVEPDAQLFPPPLLRSYFQIRNSELKSSAAFSLSEKFPGYDLIIVDGRRYDVITESQLQLTPGPHRITQLSNSRPPLTQTMTGAQLETFKSDAKAIAVGRCEEPVLVGFQDLGLKTASVFYDRNCTRSFTGTSWLKADGRDFLQPALATPPSDFTRSLQTGPPSELKSKRTWLWVGLGAALLASAVLVYSHERRGGEQVQPVQKQGYSN